MTDSRNHARAGKFAEALEVVPRTLADNAGLDATQVVSSLMARHSSGGDDAIYAGIDIEGEGEEGIVSTREGQIFDVLAAKHWAIKYAVGAAITVLNVDS